MYNISLTAPSLLARAQLAIFICDGGTITAASIVFLALLSFLSGHFITYLAREVFRIDASSYIYSLARYNKARFPWYFQNRTFDSFLVGSFVYGALFCINHLYFQMAFIFQMRDQRQVRSVQVGANSDNISNSLRS